MKRIPYAFINKHAMLSWNEAAWGYEHQYLGWSDIVELACDRLSRGDDNVWTIELAGLLKSDAHMVGDLLHKLSDSEIKRNPEVLRKKWLFIVLSWVFENRASIADPLGEVEMIYADFGYPKEIAAFVRYMPTQDEPSIEGNDSRLISKWHAYLKEAKVELGGDTSTISLP
jgi:hypothetical protein